MLVCLSTVNLPASPLNTSFPRAETVLTCPSTELTLGSVEEVAEFTVHSNRENHRQMGQTLHPWANHSKSKESRPEETPQRTPKIRRARLKHSGGPGACARLVPCILSPHPDHNPRSSGITTDLILDMRKTRQVINVLKVTHTPSKFECNE